MTTELTRYNGYRCVMRKGKRFSVGDDADKTKAGRAMLMNADCFYQYEGDLDICNALAGMMGSGMRGLALCKKNAFEDYQTCRGF